MTQLPREVRLLTPETGCLKPPRAWLDRAEPGFLRASRRHPRERTMTRTGRGDGRGFDPAGGGKEDRHHGPGLRRMNHRANLLGGPSAVPPGPDGAGTLVNRAFGPAPAPDRPGRTA